MSKYAITLARSARKELEALDASIVERIFPAIESLARASRPRGYERTQKTEIMNNLIASVIILTIILYGLGCSLSRDSRTEVFLGDTTESID